MISLQNLVNSNSLHSVLSTESRSVTSHYHGSTFSVWQQNQRRRRRQGERQKTNVYINRVLNWLRHKNWICGIMGFVRIFWKKHIQEAFLPKTSIVGQIVSEILAQLCSDDSIQILLNLTLFLMLWTESNFCTCITLFCTFLCHHRITTTWNF